MLPCASCEGISTQINLNSDGTYSITRHYIGHDNHLRDTTKGNYTIKGEVVELLDIKEGAETPFYKIEERALRHLDLKGNPVEGELAHLYLLKKLGNEMVEGKRWQLTHLYGKEIEESTPETHFIIFRAEEGRAQARANCNYLSFGYKITDLYAIRFEGGISTMMACPDDLEDKFKEVIDRADNLSVSENSLTLNKGRMAPLAIFKLVGEEE